MGDERDANEDEEAIRRRREELVRRSIEDAHVPRPDSRPMPCLAYVPPPNVRPRGGARPWVWIAACVFVASVALALLAVRLLSLF